MKENLITGRIMAVRNIASERKTSGVKEKAREEN